jgi:hypothetical protein
MLLGQGRKEKERRQGRGKKRRGERSHGTTNIMRTPPLGLIETQSPPKVPICRYHFSAV